MLERTKKKPKDGVMVYKYHNSGMNIQYITFKYTDDCTAIDILVAAKLERQAVCLTEYLIQKGRCTYNSK